MNFLFLVLKPKNSKHLLFCVTLNLFLRKPFIPYLAPFSWVCAEDKIQFWHFVQRKRKKRVFKGILRL